MAEPLYLLKWSSFSFPESKWIVKRSCIHVSLCHWQTMVLLLPSYLGVNSGFPAPSCSSVVLCLAAVFSFSGPFLLIMTSTISPCLKHPFMILQRKNTLMCLNHTIPHWGTLEQINSCVLHHKYWGKLHCNLQWVPIVLNWRVNSGSFALLINLLLYPWTWSLDRWHEI